MPFNSAEILARATTKEMAVRGPAWLMAKKISRLMLTENFTNQHLAGTVINLAKQVTGANWAEFLLLDAKQLKVTTTLTGQQKDHKQKFSTVPLTDESLPGLAALEKRSKMISNAQTSSLYATFSFKFSSFDQRFLEPEDPQSLACVPFFDTNGEVFAVVHLFDKVDDHGSLSFFSDDDVTLVEAIGELIKGVIAMKTKHSTVTKQIERMSYYDSERHILSSSSLQLVRKQSLLEAIKHLLESTKVMTYEYLDLMTEAMESQAALLHIMSEDEVLVPWLAFGFQLACEPDEEVKALCTRTSEYLLSEHKDMLIVRDYQKEKHFSSRLFSYWEKQFTSSISLPLMDGGQLVAVLEFYRSGQEYNFRDEHVAKELVSWLKTINTRKFYSRLPLSGRKNKEEAMSYKRFGRAAIETMRQFTIRPEGFLFDFVGYLKVARSSMRDQVAIESCNVYLKDTLTDSLWTWVSYNCQPLSIPIAPYSLIGYCALNRQVINEKFPCGNAELDIVAEAQGLLGQAALVFPIYGEVLKEQVLAVVILSRKEDKFTSEEIMAVQRLTEMIGMLLEYLFFHKYDLDDYSQDQFAREAAPKARKLKRIGTQMAMFPLSKTVSIDDMRFYNEVKANRDMFLEHSPSQEESYSKPLRALCQLSNISVGRFAAIKALLTTLDARTDMALEELQAALPNIIQCQIAKIFVYSETHQYLKDLNTHIFNKSAGLVKQVLTTRTPLVINAAAHTNTAYSEHIDSLGSTTPIESFLAVPLFYRYDDVIGVMVFVNSPICFTAEDVAVAQFLSLIPSKAMLSIDDTLRKWNDVLRLGLRQQMLLSWCKQIMSVSAICQQNVSNMKEVVHKLTSGSNFVEVMRVLIEVITTNMEVEDAQFFFKHREGHVTAIGKDAGVMLLQPGQELELLKDVLRSGQPKVTNASYDGAINSLIVPVLVGSEVIGGIELKNKRDLTLTNYCSFTKEDEVIALQYASNLGVPMQCWLSDQSVDTEPLQRLIRQTASAVNAYPLMSVIRKASQILLDCDRATIFIRENDNMVVYAQGTEQEIPAGFSVPVGVGIVGFVAKNCQTVNIVDAYSDPRFNPEVDKRTGYRTATVLCVPVFNSNHQVIAALQMINKRHGVFDEDDLTILDMFSDVISSALQIFDRFKSVVVERTRLLHLLNSIGSYILVINKEGKMDYCNQRFEQMFGIAEELGRSRHFSFWLRDNPDIIRDLQSVIDSPKSKVSRQFQKLLPCRQRRSASISVKNSSATAADQVFHVHYAISALQDFTTQESIGLIFIVEDVTNIVKMKKDMDMMKSKLREIQASNTVQAQTGLHSSLSTLEALQENFSSMPAESTAEALAKVISILRSGNLERAHVTFGDVGQQLSDDLKSFINKEYLEKGMEQGTAMCFDPPLSPSVLMDEDMPINLDELRNWSLDVWALGDLFPHIATVLRDCNLLAKFNIQMSTLTNFLTEIRRLYDQRGNPFHNFYHGFNVFHSSYFLLTSTKAHTLCCAEDILAVLIASLCHDVDHTGRTNSFEVSKSSNLALLYHDTSVLEQHHAAIAFFTLQQENCNIFKAIPKNVYQAIRKIIISAILATDMTKHFSIIAKMNERFQNLATAPLGSQEGDKMALLDLIVHCSDLAHPAKSFDLCLRWSLLVRQEFISQAQEEAALSLPVTAYMKDLKDVKSYLKNEVSFATYVVKPLWECLSLGLHPYVEQQVSNLLGNIESYKEKLAEEEAEQANP